MLYNYQTDFDKIIVSIFNKKPLAEQPDYLFVLPADDPVQLKRIKDLILNETERGKLLSKYPLHIYCISENVKESLAKHGIQDPTKVLFLFLQKLSKEQLNDYIVSLKGSGIIVFAEHTPADPLPPDEFVLTLAENGYFPRVEFQRRYPHGAAHTDATLNYFESRPYVIRHPKVGDITDLMELEKLCWAAPLQESQQELERRITQHPKDCLVVEKDGHVIAVNYAQRIPSVDTLRYGQWKNIATMSQPDGCVIQMITLNVIPSEWGKGYGDQLLEFLLYWRSLQPDVTSVIASTRCSEFPKHPDKTMEEYIQMKDERGFPIDPTPHFHAQHGAKIHGLILNYRPEDTDNKGFGVLIEYTVKERQYVKPSTPSKEPIKAINTREDIKQLIEENIRKILDPDKAQNYSPSIPLMTMGFDSLSLLELRSLLAARFELDLPATFFFQYGIVEKVVDYFAQRVFETYKDWLYNVEWVELPIPLLPVAKKEETGVWVIFADEGGVARHLVSKLESYGLRCVVVKSGSYFSVDNGSTITIRPDYEKDYINLFKAKSLEKGILGIIYLWGLFKMIQEEPSLDTLQSLHKFSCLGLINLIKTFAKGVYPASPKLFIGSWSLQEEGDAMSLAQWPLTALSKAINAERPDFQLRRVSLDNLEDVKQSIDCFFLELGAQEKEDQIVWRGGKRFGSRLIRIELPESGSLQFDENGSYLLVGGFGLGIRLIQWYLDKGAKHIVLVSHTDYPPEAKEAIDQLRRKDVSIDVHTAVDLGNFEQMRSIVDGLKQSSHPLKGVLFFATKVDDEQIVNQEWSRFEDLLNLKVAGSWNLHLLTQDTLLDHFVLFAGVGPSLDSRWKANRSMGNAFLDALAFYRHARALPALTIDWGPWGTQGLAFRDIVEEQIPPGLRLLTADERLNVLEHLMHISLPEVVAAPINWREFFQHYMTGRPLFANLEQEVGLKKSEIVTRFQRAREEERQEILRQYLRMHVRRVLRLGSTAKVADGKSFADLGLSDYLLRDLRHNIQQDLSDQVDLPPNLLQENTSIETFSQALYPLFIGVTHPLSTIETARNEAIAVIGMGCRLPKGVKDPEQFYQFLQQGVDGITEIPKERWNKKDSPRFGSFLDGIDLFDAGFFGISPREAKYLDPQARILLEVSWEALENAGIPPASLAETMTGVFVGISTDDYTHLLRLAGEEDAHNAYIGTGNFASAVVGRISHTLGFQGPNMAIDTACSSSLVAIHEACLSLQTRESDLVLAGGVQLNLLPDWHINFSKASMLSPDGHCKTFDASANGYVRGEGCGIVILKRLSDALRDGDPIRAVIRATAVNQDGFSTGFTVPNGQAQIALIKTALAKAQVASADIDYVEAHGTGTSLGDPIEVSAIAETYGKNRDKQNPLLLGSVKSNIGHLEAAAGVTGLIKVVLSLQHASIPMNLNFKELNPHIQLNFPFKIVTKNTPWPNGLRKRLGAVSAFGFSGTNSHAILEEVAISSLASKERPFNIVTLSAKTEQALAEMLANYKAFLKSHPVRVGDLAHTTNAGRNHFKYRLAVIAEDIPQFFEKLESKDYLSGIVTSKLDLSISFMHGAEHFSIDKTNPFHHQVFIAPDTPWLALMQTIAEYYIQGAEVDWNGFDKPYRFQKIILPNYPFQRKRYWVELQALKKEEVPTASASLLGLYWIEKPSQLVSSKLMGKWLIISNQTPQFIQNVEKPHVVTDETASLNSSYKGVILFGSEKGYQTLLRISPHFSEIEQLVIVSHGRLDESPLHGMLSVIAQEYPNVKCKAIETEEGDIVQEVQQQDNESHVKLEKGKRYVKRLKAIGKVDTPSLKPEGSYLITGGLGSLGLLSAEHLIHLGAKTIYLISRREADTPFKQWVAQHAEKGINIVHKRIDVADEEEVLKLLYQLKSSLKGIIHAAGRLDDAILRNQTWSKFENVFAPKAKGAWNLHHVSQELNIPLDFFVLFSSISSLLGTSGQANYAAANAFLDALAHERKSKGLPAISVNWAGWKEGGMAQQGKGLVNLEHQFPGVESLTNTQGLNALSQVLTLDLPEVMVAPIDPKELTKLPKNLLPLFEELYSKEIAPPVKTARLGEKLQNALPEKRKSILEDYLHDQICDVLQMPKDAAIDKNDGFFNIGMDSLLALELKNKIQQDFEQTVPETLAFDYPTFSKLEVYMEQLLGFKSQEQLIVTQRAYQSDPIAIIGMSCRFPGGVESPEAFWELLIKGIDGISEVPPDRWDNAAYFSENPEEPGKIATRLGGFVDHIDMFDAEFFGITPREAEVLDPQQRLALETTWEALENAGIAPNSLMDTLTGVFMGVSFTDYLTRLTKNPKEEINAYLASGNVLSGVTGRISYTFGLQGPCIAMDTACSSSLVALDEACQRLRLGDCNLAVAGGVNILLSPEIMITLSRAHMMAPDGHCKTFDAKADGYVRSEGCGILILKRFQDAIRDKDPILAVIRGSAVMQDGKTGGLTVPNGKAQEQVIRQALQNAKATPQEVQYIEAHGTGTSLGDPIEVQAIASVYSNHRSAPLIIGAVKSNIGHLESAAGVASVIKTVLALNHEMIPSNLHFETVNPKIHLETIPAEIATRGIPWKRNAQPRLAGISSFGFTGTIAHALLEEAPRIEAPINTVERPLHILTLSAKTKEALEALINKYLQLSSFSFPDIAFTANTGRAHFTYRTAIVAEDSKQAFSQETYSIAQIQSPPKVVFKLSPKEEGFPQQLYDSQPIFKDAFDRTKSIQEALIELWKSWGITSDTVLDLAGPPADNDFVIFLSPSVDWKYLLDTLAELYMRGVSIDWKGFDAPYNRRKVILPTYPFNRRRFWVETKKSFTLEQNQNHPLLMHQINSRAGTIFQAEIDAQRPAFIRDHKIYQFCVLAGASFVSAVISAAQALFPSDQYSVENILFLQPLIIPDNKSFVFQTIFYPEVLQGEIRFEIGSQSKEESSSDWTLHVEGIIKRRPRSSFKAEALEQIKRRCEKKVESSVLYSFVRDVFELDLGDSFQWLESIYTGENEVLGRLRLPKNSEEKEKYILHPGFIDSCFQCGNVSHFEGNENQTLSIPFSIGTIFYSPELGPPVWVHLSQHGGTNRFILYNAQGIEIGGFLNFVSREAPRDTLLKFLQPSNRVANWFYEQTLHRKILPDSEKLLQGSWLVSEHLQLPNCQCIPLPATREAIKAYLESREPVEGILEITNSAEHLLLVLQALAESNKKYPLWLITSGSSLDKAPLEGLRKTALSEHPDILCRHIDFDGEIDLSLLVSELLASDSEDEIYYQNRIRYVPRLSHHKLKMLASPTSLSIDPYASYLITGGAGGLGLFVANWLVSKGAKHIILAGRTIPKSMPREFTFAQVDISNSAATNLLFQKFGTVWPELKGIIHAAGILDDGTLLSQNWGRFEKVFAPKVIGSWNLHEASLSKHLDFFVFFSSIASVLGSPGQSNYAAANCYMDSLASQRRKQGLPGLSISWGPWGEVGMAASLTQRQRANGMVAMKPEDGMHAFDLALLLDIPHVMIADIDWKTIFSNATRKLPLLSELEPRETKQSTIQLLLPKLLNAEPSDRKEMIHKHIHAVLHQILGMRDDPVINDEQKFFEMGMDSLMSIELKNRLQNDIGQQVFLPTTLAFDYPTINTLTNHLLKTLDQTKIQSERVFTPLVIVQNTGKHPPLFALHPIGGDVFYAFALSQALGNDYPVYGLRARGLEENEKVYANAEEMLEDYIKNIRLTQPTGPYNLLGWSLGAMLACELADRLEKQGETIENLILIDIPDIYIHGHSSIELFAQFLGKQLSADLHFSKEEMEASDTSKLLNLLLIKGKKFKVFPENYQISDLMRSFNVFANHLEIYTAENQFQYKNVKKIKMYSARTGLSQTLGFNHKSNLIIINNVVNNKILDCNHFEIVGNQYIKIIADDIKEEF